MTDTIPPCPVCGTVPEYQTDNNSALLVRDSEVMLRCCGWDGFRMSLVMWKNNCTEVLYGALRTHGIHTLQQLTERMSPDPRVAVLESQNTALKIACENLNIVIDRLEKKPTKLTDKLEMVEQESEQRLSAIIGYSDQLLAMKEKYESGTPQVADDTKLAFAEMNDLVAARDYLNTLIAAQRGEEKL